MQEKIGFVKSHIGLYGNVKLLRVYCPSCRTYAFVLDGERQCCGRPVEENPEKFRRMSLAERIRKRPKEKERLRLLEKFNNRCAYCERTFGTVEIYFGKIRQVTLNWDHKIPWVYSYNNKGDNFLPACRMCNAWKGDRMFQTIDEVKVYVLAKWEEATKEKL